MEWIVIGRAEIETTPLGLAVFEGRTREVHEALERGIDWNTEKAHPLHAALYGSQLDLAARLLEAGSPVEDSTYAIAFDHLPEFLGHLPPRPDLISRIEADRRWPAFAWALVRGDAGTARSLLAKGVPINERILITHGMGELRPIHYAARNGSLELIRMVVDAGADVNALTPKGQSALRIVAENVALSRKERLRAIGFLQAHGAQCVPELSDWKDRLRVKLGWPVAVS